MGVVLWIIIAAVVLGGGYFVVQKSKSKMENAEPVAEQIVTSAGQKETEPQVAVPADWKTYRNEKYGFEFRYPAGWESCLDIRESSPESFRREHPQGSEIFCFISDKPVGLMFVKPTISGFIRNDLMTSYPSYTELLAYEKGQAEQVNSIGAGGLSWVKEGMLSNQGAFDDCFGDAGWSCDKFFIFGDSWFAISYTDSSDDSEMITDQIFSTFRFTK